MQRGQIRENWVDQDGEWSEPARLVQFQGRRERISVNAMQAEFLFSFPPVGAFLDPCQQIRVLVCAVPLLFHASSRAMVE